MRNERDIDDAIDRAVRDIMHVEPRAGFRGRVLGRLEQPGRAAGPVWFTLPRLAVAVAAAMVLAIGIAVLLRNNAPVAPADAPVVAQKEAPPPAVEVRPVAPPAADPVEPSTKTPAVRPRREPAVVFPPPGVVTATSVPDSETPPAGARPAPRAGSELIIITPAPLVITPLIVPPIVIPRIVIAPIRPPR